MLIELRLESPVPNPVDELATVTDLTAKVKTMDQRIYGMLQNL